MRCRHPVDHRAILAEAGQIEIGDNNDSPTADLVAYALDALDADESTVVRGHLSCCRSCQDILPAIADDLALLAQSVKPITPPPHIRDALLQRLLED